MPPIILNTYGTRNKKRKKSWDKINKALKEIGNSQECISMFDGSFVRSVKNVRSVKKIKEGKTGVMVKGVGSISQKRAKRKFLKDCSQKLLKTVTFKHTINKGQSCSHLTISLDTSCDTTFDQLRKAEPLQKLQPAVQCTSCTSSSGISEQVESSNNCSLFPAPRVTSRQNESSKKSSRSSCSEAESLTDFRVTSTPKGANRENKPYSPALSPISIMHEKSEAKEVEAQGITSVHSIEKKVFHSNTSRNPAGTQNDNASFPLFATFKTMPSNVTKLDKTTSSNVIELSSTFEPVQISIPADNNSLKIIGFKDPTTENHTDMSKDSGVLNKDSQAEDKYEQISLPTENNDSLEIISIFKGLKTSFESYVGLGKDSIVFGKDFHDERNGEYQIAASLDVKQAVIGSESEDLSNKLISLSKGFESIDTQNLDMHSFAEVNKLAESNVQLYRGSNIQERFYVSTDLFADFSDSIRSVKNDVCPKESSGTLSRSAVVPSCYSSVDLFADDSNCTKSSQDVLIQEPNRAKQSSSSEHLNSYCCKCASQRGKCVSSGANINCDSRLNCDTSESVNSTSCKCQESNSKRCVQGNTYVSEFVVSKHEHTSQTVNSSETQVAGKLDGCVQETTSTSAADAIKETSSNLATDASYQGAKLETDRQSQPLGTQIALVTERADTPSPGRPSCRRLSHVVVPQNNEVESEQVSTSFRKVYTNCIARMSPCVEDDEEKDTAPTLVSIPIRARQAVLHRCQQTEPIPFSQAFPDEFWDSCRKIGEGVYGEVFLSEAEDGIVFKVIPIEGDKIINEEPQKKYEEILSEIVIAMELSDLRNGTKHNTSSFSEVKKCLCVKGCYPKPLIQLWEEYDADKGSENDCPVVFEDDQLYIILVLANGGQDLEAFCFSSADQALSVLKQTACALAVAENALEFEHRDLHWGNVLIGPTSIKSVSFTINGEEFEVATKGIKATIIDFTLSRMTYDGCCIFNDLARDPTLFTSEGDYQFEVYRLMRDTVMNDWRNFEPFTNLLWLHYLLHKMITMVNYRRTNTKIHQKGISEMKNLSDNLLSFSSCSHFVSTCMMK